jgi:hypothetical protein
MELRRPSVEHLRGINALGLTPLAPEAASSPADEERRGRKKSRFSLNTMLDTLKERVAGASRSAPRAPEAGADAEPERGRPLRPLADAGKKKARSPSEEHAHGWKEFRKGELQQSARARPCPPSRLTGKVPRCGGCRG